MVPTVAAVVQLGSELHGHSEPTAAGAEPLCRRQPVMDLSIQLVAEQFPQEHRCLEQSHEVHSGKRLPNLKNSAQSSSLVPVRSPKSQSSRPLPTKSIQDTSRAAVKNFRPEEVPCSRSKLNLREE